MAARHRVRRVIERTGVSSLLLAWYRAGHRALPWRISRDRTVWSAKSAPADARGGDSYYERFWRGTLGRALAAAAGRDVRDVERLGYYSRARNMLRGRADRRRRLPRYDAIRALPGIGDFGCRRQHRVRTAARRACRRYRERRHARAFAQCQRWLGQPIGTFQSGADGIGRHGLPATRPLCLVCPLASCCRARRQTAAQLPVKPRPKRYTSRGTAGGAKAR
jgi:adenine-specific DNA glycosylase